MSSSRRLQASDRYLLKAVLDKHHRKLVRSKKKLWFEYIDVDQCIKFFYQCDNAWIVDDAYLVIYEVITPFYAVAGVKFIEEIIVLRLVAGSDFSVVPAFLERSRVEAGAVATCAGTALARNDKALASLYQAHGYEASTLLLMKGTNG